LELDYETLQLSDELAKKKIESMRCPKCGSLVQGDICRVCGESISMKREYYFDPDFSEYLERVERDNDPSNLKWEDVPTEEGKA